MFYYGYKPASLGDSRVDSVKFLTRIHEHNTELIPDTMQKIQMDLLIPHLNLPPSSNIGKMDMLVVY